GEDALIGLLRHGPESFRHAPVRRPPIAPPQPGAGHLPQPVVEMDTTKIIKVVTGQNNGLATEPIDDRIGVPGLFDVPIERSAIHGTVEVRKPFGPLADERAYLGSSL